MENLDIIMYTLLHQYVNDVWERLTFMLPWKKKWNYDHNDGLRGKKKECTK